MGQNASNSGKKFGAKQVDNTPPFFKDIWDGIKRFGNSIISIPEGIGKSIVTLSDGAASTAKGLVTGVSNIGTGLVTTADHLGSKVMDTGGSFLTGFTSMSTVLIVIVGGVLVMTVLNAEKVGSAVSQGVSAYRR